MHKDSEIISFLETELNSLVGMKVDWRFSKYILHHLSLRLLEYLHKDDDVRIETEEFKTYINDGIRKFGLSFYGNVGIWNPLFVLSVEETEEGNIFKSYT